MYCVLFGEYINKATCVRCDSRAGLPQDSWTECTSRREHHPTLDGFRWWLRPEAFYFKLLIAMRWIVRRLSPRSRIMIWSNSQGMHFGHLNFSKWRSEG